MISVFKYPPASIHKGISIESLTRDVHLKPIHSHNDYWRARPFYDALSCGCISIEADVWKFSKTYSVSDTTTETTAIFDADEIYVGHNQIHLKPEDTLANMYITPLRTLLDSANKEFSQSLSDHDVKRYGVFFDSPESTLNLWFDIKTEGPDTYFALVDYLKELSDKHYLSHYDPKTGSLVEGPVTITLTGNVPWALIKEKERQQNSRNTFLDCPMHKFLGADKDELAMYSKLCVFASASLEQLLGEAGYASCLRRDFDEPQRNKLKSFFDAAHELGLRTRIWGGVEWPNYVRDMHWRSLWELGCDLINADDLDRAASEF